MRQLGLGMLLAFSILAPGVARADDYSVQKFLEMCNEPDGSPDKSLYLGYVSGVSDVMYVNGLALRSLRPSSAAAINLSLCAKDITYGAALQAFKNWAQAHPENWQMDHEAGVVIALRELWPCK